MVRVEVSNVSNTTKLTTRPAVYNATANFSDAPATLVAAGYLVAATPADPPQVATPVIPSALPPLMTPEDAAGRAAAAAVASTQVTKAPDWDAGAGPRRQRNRMVRSICATLVTLALAATNRASPVISTASIGATLGAALVAFYRTLVFAISLRPAQRQANLVHQQPSTLQPQSPHFQPSGPP